METRVYFEKIMQDYNQNRKGRSLRCDYVRHFEDGTDAEVTKTSHTGTANLLINRGDVVLVVYDKYDKKSTNIINEI